MIESGLIPNAAAVGAAFAASLVECVEALTGNRWRGPVSAPPIGCVRS